MGGTIIIVPLGLCVVVVVVVVGPVTIPSGGFVVRTTGGVVDVTITGILVVATPGTVTSLPSFSSPPPASPLFDGSIPGKIIRAPLLENNRPSPACALPETIISTNESVTCTPGEPYISVNAPES